MDLKFLSRTALFHGNSLEEISEMLACLGAEERRYSKGSVIFHAGQTTRSMGLLLSGRVSVESDDVWGNKSMLDHLGPGHVFGETYAALPQQPMMVSVVASEPAEVLWLDVGRMLHQCFRQCTHHGRLVANLLAISAHKNLALSRRIFHTAPKTIRGRLLSYLSFQAAQQGRLEFHIPLSRQQLADYLNVDRSALSNELGKMRREGLLEADRNHFILHQPPDDTFSVI